jgi:hypothetical protein
MQTSDMLRLMAAITGVVVHFVAEDDSSRRVTLDEMRGHCRPERVEDLLDDLVVLCEDVATGRRPEDKGRARLAAVPTSR